MKNIAKGVGVELPKPIQLTMSLQINWRPIAIFPTVQISLFSYINYCIYAVTLICVMAKLDQSYQFFIGRQITKLTIHQLTNSLK